jgi:YidC/Oxa1 family membrane protein insertase
MNNKSIAIWLALLIAILAPAYGQNGQPPATGTTTGTTAAAGTAAGTTTGTAGEVAAPAAGKPAAAGATTSNLEHGTLNSSPRSLSNGTLRLEFAPEQGAGIASVALLKNADVLENRKAPAEHPYLFNREGLDNLVTPSTGIIAPPAPALGLAFRFGNGFWSPKFSYDAAGSTATRAVFTADVIDPNAGIGGGTVRITRTFTITGSPAAGTSDDAARADKDPHVIRIETSFRSLDNKPFTFTTLQLNLGALPPTEGDYTHQFLGVGACDGDSFLRDDLASFTPSSGFFGLGKSEGKTIDIKPNATRSWKWASVTNQYFAAILQFDNDTARSCVTDLVVRPLYRQPPAVPGQPPTAAPTAYTLTGDVVLQLPVIAPGQTYTFSADYYVGPREYSRLADLGHAQEKAVHFAKLWFISVDFLCKIFVVILDFLYGLTGGWALAIIALTILIKALTWPLVTAQQRSAEKMRKFSGPMKEIRERYKDDPKKQQMAMMELYKEHKINPLAGCLPVLIQIPIFSGLFFTFQSLAQLRFQSFLWISDLSMPDLIPGLENFTILGVHLHILPLFMGLTMLLNMKLTPMPNVEGQQKLIFYGMMVMFPVICYGMPSALMLYYSVQNVLTIFQTFITRRRFHREEELAAAAGTAGAGAPAAAAGTPRERPRGKGKFSR